ncbi:hypothetical protein GCM10010168_76270 [Actinoplanes ianthinogenes]|uniref:DUF4097 domain-containing protein n=1 Tax=Actinoplanes ianthinogenes TaxID=122358 RepID=A0ABN6CT73_9ACTN|nr:DUF4097 family beta strand repeat-containing protein [Actinoplanes ianthinogenes]BCJ48447.1 hypothetical protein Aiant_91040 [Actinoplanes ianthinogenes]GGR46306.1 hypothetical protein GCM10010168_76270 [Actinoplanes ianthinogenes]
MQNFTTPAPIAAVLDIPAGHIHVIATERADTAVEVRPADPAKARDVRVAEQARVEFADGLLRIEATARNQPFGPSGSIEVTVLLPAGSRVEAKSACAGFRAEGRFGDVAFEGAQATITIGEATRVRVATSGGDVAVGRLTGPAEISTGQGDIRIAEAGRGTVVLSTQMGDVSVTAAHGVSAALDAGTGYGRVDNSLKNDGDAELEIRATTSYGDIVARSL